MRIVSKLKTL